MEAENRERTNIVFTVSTGIECEGLMKNKVIIIAEAGVNHNGSVELAKKMIDVAAEAKADMIKFQSFKTECEISKNAPKADYQKAITGEEESQFEMAKKLELTEEEHKELMRYCQEKGVVFFSTPFDFWSIDLLNNLGMDTIKIPSGELTNLPYLEKIAALKKKIILSTGMATLGEVESAIAILNQFGTTDITLLHCTTEYPTPYADVNLNAVRTLKHAFGLPVGYSDHTNGVEVSVAAVAIGATVIEKHFTLDKNMEGPDHQASIEPDELKLLVQSIRHVEAAMGDGVKRPAPSEVKNMDIARKSIVANCDIQKGDIFTVDNLTTKRPGNGISPMKWHEILGQVATKDYKEDELL